MDKYDVELEGQGMTTLVISKEKAKEISDSIKDSGSVPLFATTFAKSKYGNCIIGRIISITKTN